MTHNIIKSVAVLAIGTMMLTGCGKEKEYQCTTKVNEPCAWCEVSNPLEDLPWMKNLVENGCTNRQELRIYVCRMTDGRQVFFIADNYSDGFEFLMNCKGETIGKRGGIAGIVEGDWDIDWDSKKLIYENSIIITK